MCLPSCDHQKCTEKLRDSDSSRQLATGYMAAALLWLFENPENVGWIKPTGSMQGGQRSKRSDSRLTQNRCVKLALPAICLALPCFAQEMALDGGKCPMHLRGCFLWQNWNQRFLPQAVNLKKDVSERMCVCVWVWAWKFCRPWDFKDCLLQHATLGENWCWHFWHGHNWLCRWCNLPENAQSFGALGLWSEDITILWLARAKLWRWTFLRSLFVLHSIYILSICVISFCHCFILFHISLSGNIEYPRDGSAAVQVTWLQWQRDTVHHSTTMCCPPVSDLTAWPNLLPCALVWRSYFESTKHIDIKVFGSNGCLSYAGEDGCTFEVYAVHCDDRKGN